MRSLPGMYVSLVAVRLSELRHVLGEWQVVVKIIPSSSGVPKEMHHKIGS